MAQREEKKSGKMLSGAGLVLGAAGLLLFIVGLKRSHHLDEEHTTRPDAGRERDPRDE